MTLDLVLTYYWYDQIKKGLKDVEYREMTDYWTKRIWKNRDKIKFIKFRRGYTNTAIVKKVIGFSIGLCPYDGWNDCYYKIYFKDK